MTVRTRVALAAAVVALAGSPAPGQQAQPVPEIPGGVLRVDVPQPLLPLSRLDLAPEDLGLAGARVAVADNNTTGSFLGQNFTLVETVAAPEDAVAALEAMIGQGIRFIATLADAETTLLLADAAADRALILNALAPDDRLRGADCRPNLLHLAPSRAMLADALAQFLMFKRWDEWFLVAGSHPEDELLGEAYARAAGKFGAEIVETRVYEDTGGARRTDVGHVQVQAQMPVFTQRAPDHDVVIAADENEVFSAYLPYHTWEPRPVAGSAGLEPVSWSAAHEAWGATQMQRRFEAAAGRGMRPEDYNACLALRVIGEAATRANSADADVLTDYILGPDFEVAGFKGQALTFRPWDGQLRQPILLTAGDIVVSVSPQDQYLHQVSVLDTLGTDQPESGCSRD